MSEFREAKQCHVVTVHEAHPWGELYGEYWACAGVREEELDANLDELERKFDELAKRVKKHQVLSLKSCFEQAFLAGLLEKHFTEWWDKFIEEERWNECSTE